MNLKTVWTKLSAKQMTVSVATVVIAVVGAFIAGSVIF